MNKLKKISMAAFGVLATIAPTTAVLADEAEAPRGNDTAETKPSDNVGRVNYVYKVKNSDTQLGEGHKEGIIGEDFVINPEVIKDYKYVGVEGEASGKFSNETPTITFYYESTTGETAEKPKEEKPAEDKKEEKDKDKDKDKDKKKDDVEEKKPETSTTTTPSTTEKKNEVTTPSTTTEAPKEEPAQVVNPTINAPVETATGEKVVGTTDNGQVIVANEQGQTSVVAPEKVGGQVKSDGSIQLKDKSGKLVKIPTTGAEAALVSIMLAGGSVGATGIATFLRSKRK